MKKALSIFCTLIMVLSVFGNFAVTAFGASLTISYITVDETYSYYEKTNGFEAERWNEETGEYESYWYYYLPNYYDVTIHYEDGTEQTYGYWDLYDEYDEYPSYDYNQDESPLTVGENLLPVTFMGYETTVTLNIKEIPFSSISIDEPVKMYENTNGYESDRWNEEIGTYESYWHYYMPSNYKVTLYYKDGTTQTMNYDQLNDEFGAVPSVDESDQYSTSWGVGSHMVPVTFMGLSTEMEIIVEECPISSISVAEELTLYENSNGYESEYYDDNTGEYIPYWHYYYNDPSLTVNYKDGSTEVLTFDELGEKFNDYPEMEDTQYQEPWGIGAHEVSISFMKLTATMTVNVEKFSLNFTVTPTESTTYYKNTNGYETTAWNEVTQQDETFWYYYIPDYNITLTLPDGTTKDMSAWEFENEYGIDVEIDHGQYENHWDVGEHDIIFRINDAEVTMTVTVEKAPFESISIDEVVTVYEYTNGYWEYDDEGEKYWDYNIPSQYITLNYSDGSTRRVYSWDLYDEFGVDCRYRANQYYNHWSVGENTVEVEFMGFTTDLIVNVVECPFTSISVTEPVTLFEEVDGYWEDSWDDEMEDYESYFYYSYRVPSLTVTYKDGTTETIGYWDLDERYGAYPQKSDNQYNEHWGLGEHKADVSFMGLTTQMTVNVVEFPVVSFTVNPTSDTTFYENTHGYMTYSTDDNGDRYDFWHYDTPDYNLTLTLNDGTTETLRAWEVEEKYGVYVSNSSDQYIEPWGVGEHEVTFRLNDLEATMSVTIKESPIESISVENYSAQIWEGTNGYEIEIWDDETDDSIGTYWIYSYPRPEITLHYKDGSEETVGYWDLYDMFGADPEMSDTQYMEPWGIGEHEVTVSFMGCETTITVEIVESPIVSFTVNAIGSSTYFENTNGYWYEHFDAEAFYWCYYIPDYEITLKLNDGTSKTLDSWDFEDEFGFNPSIYHGQYESPWGLGEHEVIFKIGNLQASMTVEIIEFPLESFSVTPTSSAVFYENSNGYRDEYWDSEAGEYKDFWYYQIPNCKVTLNYKDGTSETLSVWELEYEYGIDVSVNHGQYNNPWGVGEHEVTFEIAGLKASIFVEIIEFPIVSFTVIPEESTTYYENTNGYESEYWNNTTGEYETYWHYYIPDVRIEAKFKDGSTVNLTSWGFEDEYGVDVKAVHNQQESHWGLGENTITYKIGKCEAELTVKVVECPIVGFTAEIVDDSPIYVNTKGYMEEIWDYETDEVIDEYWYYYIPEFKVKLKLNDGTTQTLDSNDVYDIYGLDVDVLNNQYQKHWGVGTNEATIRIGEFESKLKIEILASPVKSLQVLDLKLAENGNVTGKVQINYKDGKKDVAVIHPDDYYGHSYKGYNLDVDVTNDNIVTISYIGATVTYKLPTEPENSFVYIKQNDTAVITGYVGPIEKDMTLTIPSEIDGLKVVAIADFTVSGWSEDYYGRTELIKTLVLPDSVTAFSFGSGLYNLETLKLGKGIREIDVNELGKKYNLKNINIKNDVYKDIDGVLYTADGKTLVYYPLGREGVYEVPAGVKDIRALPPYVEYTMKDASVFKEVDGVVYTADMKTLVSCNTDKTGNYTMPETVVDMYDYAFLGCTSLESVTVSKKVTEISYAAFSGCTSLKSVDLPASLKKIDQYAFDTCENLETLKLHDLAAWCGVDFLSYPVSFVDNVYLNNKALTSITIPEGVKTINYGAFISLPASVKSVTIPSTLKVCEGIESRGRLDAVYTPDLAAWCGIDFSYDSPLKFADNFYVNGKAVTSVVIPGSVKRIGDYAFAYAPIKTLTIPDTVNEIGFEAFSGTELDKLYVSNLKKWCTADYKYNPMANAKNVYIDKKLVTELVIPEGVTEIPDYRFSGVPFNKVKFPSTIKKIGEGAFAYSNLESYSFVSGAKNVDIDSYAFAGTNIETASYGSESTKINSTVFYNSKLTKLNISESVTEIAYGAFYGSSSLKTINAPNTAISIKAHAFDGTAWYNSQPTGMTFIGKNLYDYKGQAYGKIVIPNGTKSVSELAFEYQDGVESITLPSSLEIIEAGAFAYTDIETITIPENVNKIGVYAFGRTNLKDIKVSSKNKYYTAVDGVLYNKDMTELIMCAPKKTGKIVVPCSVKYIHDYAFADVENVTVEITTPNVKIGNYAIGYGNYSLYSDWYHNDWIGDTGVNIKAPKGSTGEKYADENYIYYAGESSTPGHDYDDNVCTKCGDWNGTEKEVKLKSATNVTGGVKISWSAIPGAEKYVIYRKTSAKAEWKKLYTTKTAASAYTDKTAKSGTKYYYTVKAARDGEYSQYDNDGISRTYLAVPKISSVSNKSSYVEIKWGKVTGASSYDVYRKVKGGSWAKLDSTKSTTFKDKTAKAGKVYEYKVRAKVGKSTTSEFSSVKKIVRLTTPKLTKVTATSGKVTFTFGKVTGAEKYYIYRKTGSGSYKKIATTTSTKYVDKSVKKGTTYTYTVKAVKSSYSSAYNSTGLKVKAK